MAVFKRKSASDRERMPEINGAEKAIKKADRKKKKQERKAKRKNWIIREVTWPSFPSALLQTAGSIAAVAVLSALVYFYQYGINQLIAYIK